MALALRANMPGYGGEVLQHIYPSSAIAQALTAPVFLGNAAFLQRILVPELGTNGPLWSLANEFWYYLLFPAHSSPSATTTDLSPAPSSASASS